ncbi:glycosyltransferase [bacterium]|nr:glycosyltransferase [bacterium]
MKKINFSGPINSLSFGNVTYNMLKSLHGKGVDISFFPMGSSLDFSAYDKVNADFKSWIDSSYNNRFSNLSKESVSLKMWHINGAESRVGTTQYLYTFYEADEPTETETNICKIQDKCIFSSSHARDCFDKSGVDDPEYIPIGFDTDFFETNKTYLEGRINFGIVGKFEKRKHTERIIKLWADRYGNNNDYQLTCCINNPFFKPEQMGQILTKATNGKRFRNINFLPHLKTNSEMNEVYNSIDINLSGLSGAEGWNLPAFNSTCLGKWSVVLNATSHKDWATKDNSILVEPEGQEEIYDGAFFQKGQPFNQGNLNTFSDQSFYKALDKAIDKYDKRNEKGVEIKEVFTYDNTVEKILNLINK